MGGMMQDLAFAIPGVDEAMGFAEIMKWVRLDLICLHASRPSRLRFSKLGAVRFMLIHC